MEYLKSINDKLKRISEENIEYIDLFDRPDLVFGTTNYSNDTVDFCKVPYESQQEIFTKWSSNTRSMQIFKDATCGNVIRFHTNSKKVIFKIKLRRKWSFEKLLNWNSLGFDVYNIGEDNKTYTHNNIFGPMDGHDIFANTIYVPKSGNICVYLPSYTKIEELYLGINKGCVIKRLDYPNNQLPVIFYGNSVTQGAAASRSANAFPNIVSRKLNREIINLSISSCCKGMLGMAEMIGKINCHSIVIDYTRNANSKKMLMDTHEKFYKTIRKYHPNIKIILLTSENFNNWAMCDEFDQVVERTFMNARLNGDNTDLIYQNKLFDPREFSYVAVDSAHYTDYGMFKIADEICKLLKE